jgi:ribosome biogenesis GTPase A
VRALVLGVPNVGKSTLSNTLVGRKAAQVGDKPAVTRALQRVEVDATFVISDFPGMTWPKIGDERTGLALAFCGSIPDTAIDLETVALYGAGRLLADYAPLVLARYKLTALPADAEALLDEVGRRRGALRAGGVVDRDKAAAILIHDFRAGLVGRVSLERPPPPRGEPTVRAEDEAGGAAEGGAP